VSLTPAERLRVLQEERVRASASYELVERALAEGRITVAEYRHYLRKAYDGKTEAELHRELHARERRLREEVAASKAHRHHVAPVVSLFLIIILVLGLGVVSTLSGGDPATAHASYDVERNDTLPAAPSTTTPSEAASESLFFSVAWG